MTLFLIVLGIGVLVTIALVLAVLLVPERDDALWQKAQKSAEWRKEVAQTYGQQPKLPPR